MAKKVRRIRRKKNSGDNAKIVDNTPKLTVAEQFEMEYSYVLKDLRQILILAVIMFTLLIAVNLFLS